MHIPAFPDSREITLADKPLFDAIFAANPPELSAYTFTNLFAWRVPYNTRISTVGDMVLVHHRFDNREICLQPIGDNDPAETIEQIIHLYPNTEFERVHAQVAEALLSSGNYRIKQKRDDFDYLYASDDLIELSGRKYDGKRNFVKRFKAENNWEYVVLDAEIAEQCLEFAHAWCEDRDCETVEGLRREYCAIYEMLTNFDALDVIGGALKADGRIVAFELGEALNPNTIVIHVEKGENNLYGVYQAMNNEFCIAEAAAFDYVNREQDLGVPGLRKAKESYQPTKLVEAYTVKRT